MAAKESLFEVLKRSPWWLSLAIAIGIAASLQLFFPLVFALFAALPFAIIGVYAGWRQRGVPGEGRTAQILEQARALNWDEFSAVIAESYRAAGYAVTPHAGDAADFELRKGGRTTLLACRRWKTAQTGVGPLKELREAMRAQQVSGCAYAAAGEVSETARRYAGEQGIELLDGVVLAKLLAASLKRRGQ